MCEVRYKSLDFLGFPAYRVGDNGSVWSYQKGHWKEMSPQVSSEWGHLSITLHAENKKPKRFLVHRLVLLAFVGPCPPGMESCHFPDRNPVNNNLINLRWDTHKANNHDKKIHGTSVGNRGNSKGADNGRAKLSDDDVIDMRVLYASGDYTQKQLAKMFQIAPSQVWFITSGKSWKTTKGPITNLGKGGNRESQRSKIRRLHLCVS